PRTKYEHLLYISARRACVVIGLLASRERYRHEVLRSNTIRDVLYKHIKEKLRIARTRRRLWVELYREERAVLAIDTLVAPVIRILEKFLPPSRKCTRVYLEPVVLGGD